MNPNILVNMEFPQMSPKVIQLLEKEVKDKNLEIIKLKGQLSEASKESSLQKEKYRSACEARDDLKFKVFDLERQVNGLKQENEKLETNLKGIQNFKSSREIMLEALVKTYEDQHQKPEENIQMNKVPEKTEEIMSVTQLYQSKELQEQVVTLEEEITMYKNQLQTKELKITQLECEKTEIIDVLKKEMNEYQEKLQVEKDKNGSLLEELKILKETSRVKNIPENDQSVELGEEIRDSILRECLKWEEITKKLQNDLCDKQKIMSSIKEKILLTQCMKTERKGDAQEDSCLTPSSRNLQRSKRTEKQVIPLTSKENNIKVPLKKTSVLKKNKENVSEIASEKEILQPTSENSSKKDTMKRNKKVRKDVFFTPEQKDPELHASPNIEETATRPKGQESRELRPRRRK